MCERRRHIAALLAGGETPDRRTKRMGGFAQGCDYLHRKGCDPDLNANVCFLFPGIDAESMIQTELIIMLIINWEVIALHIDWVNGR